MLNFTWPVLDLHCGCSHHPAAQLHAAARAVSGASVYVSDYPGKHDFSILKQLVLADGSVHRALLPGKPTLDSLFVDPLRDNKSLLKVTLHMLSFNPARSELACMTVHDCTTIQTQYMTRVMLQIHRHVKSWVASLYVCAICIKLVCKRNSPEHPRLH